MKRENIEAAHFILIMKAQLWYDMDETETESILQPNLCHTFESRSGFLCFQKKHEFYFFDWDWRMK